MGGCPAQTDPNTQWPGFCPNSGAAYLFAIFFGLTLTTHIVQSIIYRKGYSWVIAMGALWEMACYVFRILSIKHVANSTYYSVWFILMLVTPPVPAQRTNPRSKANQSLACPTLDQCIRLHGLGQNGVQLHLQRQDFRVQSMEIRPLLRTSRHICVPRPSCGSKHGVGG